MASIESMVVPETTGVSQPDHNGMSQPDHMSITGVVPNIVISPSDEMAGVGIPQISIPAYGAS